MYFYLYSRARCSSGWKLEYQQKIINYFLRKERNFSCFKTVDGSEI